MKPSNASQNRNLRNRVEQMLRCPDCVETLEKFLHNEGNSKELWECQHPNIEPKQ